MVARAAKLCGMATEMNDAAVRNMLSQFGDYMSAAEWAKGGLAFCYKENILDQSALNIQPLVPVRRSEIAQMLYNLLNRAELL